MGEFGDLDPTTLTNLQRPVVLPAIQLPVAFVLSTTNTPLG